MNNETRDDGVFYWDEDSFEPATPEEMRSGLIEAMAKFRAEGLIPEEDPGCECVTCRAFRAYIEEAK